MAIAEIHVTLKPALLDVQGQTVLRALQQLGHNEVQDVRIRKVIFVQVSDALAGAALQTELDKMCAQLLANPVIENYDVRLLSNPGEVPDLAVTAPLPATQTGVIAPPSNP
jgi:phosphoribosylformylglycinamidine synthase